MIENRNFKTLSHISLLSAAFCTSYSSASEPEISGVKKSMSVEEQQDSNYATRRNFLEEVIVTATKREKSLRDIPASISAFSGDSLEQQGILSINDVLEQTPGVTANSARPGDQRIVMRGISTSAAPTSVVPQPVGIFIGDTALNEPYAASITPDLSAFDLAAVEVLKGPQGTLFGGAALSGVLRYRLNEAVPHEWQASYFAQNISLEEGDSGLTQGFMLNIPVFGPDGNLGLRLTYIDREYPGFTDDVRRGQEANDVNGSKGKQYRLGATWTPGDNTSVKLTYLAQDYQADNDIFIADNTVGPRETRSSFIKWPNEHRIALYNLEVQHEWESVRLVSSSSRTEKERKNIIDGYFSLFGTPSNAAPDGLAIPFLTNQKSSSFQQELRLQSQADDKFEWLVGVYYLDSPIDYFLSLTLQATDQIPLLDSLGLRDRNSNGVDCSLSLLCAQTNANAQEKAVFFDTTWYPTASLELSLGGRYYQTGVDGGYTGEGIVAQGVSLLNLVATGEYTLDNTAEISEEGMNPKVSVTYRFTDEHSVYALVNKGFRFGGIQTVPEDELQNVPGTYKSDTIMNYEIGMRTRWLDNTLEFDLTAFHIDFDNPLVVLKNALAINYYDNVGSAESDGIEVNLRWQLPVPGFLFSLSGGTVDAHTLEDFIAGNDFVPAGTPLPGSAEYQYAASLAFSNSPQSWLNVSGHVTYSYVGKSYNDLVDEDTVNDYGTYSAGVQLRLTQFTGRPSLGVNVLNITNETTPVGIVKPAINGDNIFILNAPRAVSARLSLEF
ncbi:TonB-dependent receptor [Zhongshania aquimaris]|uniref:TonB-dependent receptor n=1 Tax=Zhongshania aquimaris TaxID=2857107 RepID=A0ABS6VPA1_9GAMM|nr:TonB-dependent receptor [Zhongshania aquimaris]MBW2940126.1 TonB-dependent receptor [Zhongshania aquimaris]